MSIRHYQFSFNQPLPTFPSVTFFKVARMSFPRLSNICLVGKSSWALQKLVQWAINVNWTEVFWKSTTCIEDIFPSFLTAAATGAETVSAYFWIKKMTLNFVEIFLKNCSAILLMGTFWEHKLWNETFRNIWTFIFTVERNWKFFSQKKPRTIEI